MAEAEERDDHEHGERSTAHYSNQQCGDDSRVAECSQLNVVLRTRISSSPNRIRQVYSSHRKEMAITEGSVRGRSGSQVELSEPRTTYPSMLQGGLRHTSDVKEIASGTHDRGRTPRTVLHTNRSSYDFQAVRQKFETLSKCGVMQPVDFSVPPGQRSRSVHRTSRKDIYQRSHSATSRKSTVQSAPPSPGASRSVLDLSNTNVNLERRHSGNVLPFSPPSSVNRSSSSSTTASRSLQSSTNTYHKSPNFLLPDNSVGAAIAFFSQQSTVPKSYSSRRCDKESQSKMLKKSPQFSPHVANSHSSNQYSQQVPKHSSRLEFAQQQSTLDAEGQSTHNLDNWLQSVVTAKEMHMNSQDRSRNRHKSDNSLVSGARSTSSERYQCGDIWTQLRNRDQGCDQRNWSQVKNVPHDNSKITPQCNLATETDVILNSQKTSGKFSDWESTGVNYTSLTRDKSNFRDVGSTKDPPVIICITQDPEDTETELLNLSQSQLDEELSTQHLPLSPRSSFGSVCSFKSSNADSAVDMNNPDEESSDTVISPRQNHPPVTSHSTISASEASAPSSPTATHLPEVLVSDHSGPNVTESTVTVQATGQSLGFDVKDLERIPRPWSPEDSAYSGNSDLSLDDTDEEEPLPPPRRKQSSWKIIRSIVRWSPFVQVFKKNKYPWIQLAGHQGNFQAGESGAVLKKLDSREKQCYLKLMTDTLYPFVPEYRGDTEKSGEKYIQLQDLLCEFTSPCVMDVKMGCRTYLEEELEKARSKPTLRKDMYKKMVEVDPNAPTQEEREKEGVTKARYLQWRDEMSSSVNLGFRIEGIKKSDGSSSKDFKKTKTRDHVYDKLKSFIGENTNAISQYIERLKAIRDAQEESEFFQRHEVISSSLLFVHDAEKANIWMIDFGKTEPLPASINIDHRSQWCEGNHEDGYLSGLDGLLSILTDLLIES